MADQKGICKATGVENWKWSEYAGRARGYLGAGQAPRIISGDELINAIDFVQNNTAQICETADGRAKAAFVLGYVTEAESIDTTIPATEVREVVVKDYHNFRHLVPLTAESSFNGTVNRFANDVKDMTSYFFGDHRFLDGPTSDQEAVLQGVIDQVRLARKQGKKPVVVFDLDDTLFDPSRRELRLLNELVDEFLRDKPGVLSQDEVAFLRSIKPEALTYNVKLDLQVTFGFTNKAFLDAWGSYFLSHFFRSDYCKDDPAYPGAAEYVNAVQKAGATIVYFTGRHEKGSKPGTETGMREGSVEALGKNGFPVPNGKSVYLIMKPDFDAKDMDYKGQALGQILKMGVPVAAFDNEPVADGLFVKAGFSTVVDLGMVQAPFYDPKKPLTLQTVPSEPETVMRINDFRRLSPQAGSVAQTKPGVKGATAGTTTSGASGTGGASLNR